MCSHTFDWSDKFNKIYNQFLEDNYIDKKLLENETIKKDRTIIFLNQ